MEKNVAPQFAEKKRTRKILTRGRILALSLCVVALGSCLIYTWMTQDVVAQLSFLRQRNGGHGGPSAHKSTVSIETWQTANTLLPMAVSAEEQEYARAAERLADHEVDQAFATALRIAGLRSHHAALSGDAQDLAQKVTELEQIVKQDKQQVLQLGGSTDTNTPEKKDQSPDDDNLELARAQFSLDSGQLDDARNALARLMGDNSNQIQEELNTYHSAQQQAQNDFHTAAAHAITSARKHRTLMLRIGALQHQNSRKELLIQAAAQVAAEIKTITVERASAQQKLAAIVAASASQNRLEQLKSRNSQRQILGIYDDRIETDTLLVSVYNKWIAQVGQQRRILMYLIAVSLAWVFFTLLTLIVAGILIQRLLDRLPLDNRQEHTLRTLARMGLQLTGAIIILLIVFGVPQKMSTILGLTTAALTIALQDFVLSFFGWFLLMGRNGIHVGDWVEINGVNGEVVEVGLFNTTLLELNSLLGKGRLTGRRIAFLNSFAIRGQYFNFSTSSQWMWDDVSIGIPKTLDVHQVAAEIEELVRKKTEENAHAAEHDWQRAAHGSLMNMAAASAVSMRPTADGIEVTVHYVTRATERFAARDRLYLQLLELLQAKQEQKKEQP